LAASGQLSLVTDIQPFNPNQFHEPRPQLGLAKTQPPIDVVPTTTRGELRMPVLTRSLKTEMCYLSLRIPMLQLLPIDTLYFSADF
jgi:hypothetical protein